MSNRNLIIDAYNLFTRHYVAHPAMSENGEQVGGAVGFFNNLVQMVERTNPTRVIIVWESGGSKRKRDLFPDYKQGKRPQKLNRYYEQDIPDTIQNRNFQIGLLVSLVSCFPVTQMYIEDSEADDAIGYMCKYKLSSDENVVLSSDHDFYQLLNKKTIIWSPTLKSFVNAKKVIERFNVHPNNFCLAKSISGDSSDNIPGVKGVSYKTLSKYFQKFRNESDYLIDDFLLDAETLSKSKNLKILKEIKVSEALIRRNWKLVHLDVNNLVHHQTSKIDEKIENCDNTCDNMTAHKILKNAGITGIDLLRSNFILKRLKSRG
jgi:5'-3' exonuclease